MRGRRDLGRQVAARQDRQEEEPKEQRETGRLRDRRRETGREGDGTEARE